MLVDPWRLQRRLRGGLVVGLGRPTKRCDVVEVGAGVGFVMGCQCWSLHDTVDGCGLRGDAGDAAVSQAPGSCAALHSIYSSSRFMFRALYVKEL